jgi:hypothetical protein
MCPSRVTAVASTTLKKRLLQHGCLNGHDSIETSCFIVYQYLKFKRLININHSKYEQIMKTNYKKFNNILIFASLSCILTSCSVIMAAKKEGTNIETVQSSRTRGQILSSGPAVISSERLPDGQLVEVYQFQKEKGSAARALMHGVLDVSTCGLWEVVGTPIEACLDDKKYFSLRVYYDQYENATKMELI